MVAGATQGDLFMDIDAKLTAPEQPSTIANDTIAGTSNQETSTRRERSRILFPYGDLEAALEVAKAIFARGGQRASLDQLADAMGHHDTTSGTFRFKLSTARIFGLMNFDGDQATLTDLGQEIVDRKTEVSAKVRAFLHVPLYRKIYELHKGKLLPKDPALEQEMESLGVVATQKIRARQTFQRSASEAGMFNETRDRLIIPAGVSLDSSNSFQETAGRKMENNGFGSHQQSPSPELNVILLTLFDMLPPPGSTWPHEKRQQWIEFAQRLFNHLYIDSETQE
jgi:hypothetical protein